MSIPSSPSSPQDSPWLSPDNIAGIRRFVMHRQWLAAGESVLDVGRAGQGNMNLTLRVRTSTRTFILKQARPWVEKYPHIPAPVERAASESRFYEFAAAHPALVARMPKLLGTSIDDHVLMLEDLGDCPDAQGLYSGQGVDAFAAAPLPELIDWLARLHAVETSADQRSRFVNRALRQLNHAHMFQIPYQDPPALDLDALTPGLADVAAGIRRRPRIVEQCRRLGEHYLADGQRLLHGDFFPGSWLLTPRGVRIIDPEFCFCGPPEFDVGVMLGHLRLIPGLSALEADLLDRYERIGPSLDRNLARRFAAAEVLRRLLGVAQLPLKKSLEEQSALIDAAAAVLEV